MEIFAWALLGMTVFAPSPVYPPQIPLTSRVGRIDLRSSVVYPFSPLQHLIPMESLNFFQIKRCFAFLERSCSEISTT